MTHNKPVSVDEYIAGFPQKTQEVLQQIRATIQKAVPEAKETISYAIPTFTLHGSYLIYFAGFKNHTGIYPVPREDNGFREELALYKGGKGTVQFPLNQPLPMDLITRIVQFRIKETLAAVEKRKSKKQKNKQEQPNA
ncbi:MAG: DUF1801 domain-containing protein [Bacteroidota bacterium]|nr:DUF1801 domain-containing protein [Bacteroidota bacterium]